MRNITKAISRTLLASPGRTSAIGDNSLSTTAPLVVPASICEVPALVLPRIPHIPIFPFTALRKVFELYELTGWWAPSCCPSCRKNGVQPYPTGKHGCNPRWKNVQQQGKILEASGEDWQGLAVRRPL